jgi:hypothetical protein
MHSGVSWVFALRELAASASLPGGLDGTIGYRDDRLSIGGGMFGSSTLEVDFVMPKPDPSQLEIAQLAELAKKLGRALVEDAARDWLERNAKDKLKQMFE